MTDAPERIWACRHEHGALEAIDYQCDGTAEYVRADVAHAMVAAALEEAAKKVPSGWHGAPHSSNMDYGPNVSSSAKHAIRALIPDAGAALDRALEKAREEEREACAKLAHDLQVSADQINDAYAAKRLPGVFLEPDGYEIAAAIRARADQGEKK